MNENLVLSGEQAILLLEAFPSWGNMTTIIVHNQCVFEFKGPFPKGNISEGYYNIGDTIPGLHAHIKLEAISRITLQTKPHRGRESYAFVFQNINEDVIFKVFLGRDENGTLLANQVKEFMRILNEGIV